MLKPTDMFNSFDLTFMLAPNFQMHELSSILQCLKLANEHLETEVYRWVFTSRDGHPVSSDLNIPVNVDKSFADLEKPHNVILLGDTPPTNMEDDLIFGLLRNFMRNGSHIGAIGSASSLLISAGLIREESITSHWNNIPAISEDYPHVDVQNCLYTKSSRLFTSAGGSSVIDFFLSEINSAFGSDIAEAISRTMLHDRIRSGEEKQHVLLGQKIRTANPKLVRTVEMMEANIETPLSLDQLADRAGSCRRQLERLFLKHLKVSPVKFYVDLRLEHAHRLITQTSISITEVALACGFNSSSHFSRSYKKKYKLSPYVSRHTDRIKEAA